MKNKGLIHIYTGDGKGKTTASLGLALRACGHNRNICIFQFLKDSKFSCGETKSIRKMNNIDIIKFNQTHPDFKDNLTKKEKEKFRINLKKQISKDFTRVKEKISSRKYSLVILDEIINVLNEGFLNKDDFLNFIKNKPEEIELVLTGRGASEDLIKIADYVTETKKIKHPFDKNQKSRKGIEY